MHVNWTYCADHFAIYTNIESLCCTPEINKMLYVEYTSVKKNRGPRNRPTQICSVEFLTMVQVQFNGGKIGFSTNGAGAIGYP